MPDADASRTDLPVPNGVDIAKAYEKAWWQSKKFFAFLLCEIGFFVLMGSMIYMQELDKLAENVAFMVLAVTAGFGMVGYCLGQSYLERYVRVAALAIGRDIQNGSSKPPPAEDNG